MMRICELRCVFMAVSLTLVASTAQAQIFESVGPRAQGMGGAFVAVADDASAAWWNPAGLASGAFFNVLLEKGRLSEPKEADGTAPAYRNNVTGFSAAFPALGISYYRLQLSQIAPINSIEPGDGSREDQEEGLRLLTVPIRHFGSTIGQSFGDHFVLGTTLKVLNGGVAVGPLPESGDPLDVADDLEADKDTRFDLDLGAMARFGALKLGFTMRNVTRPTFGSGTDTVKLARQARTGVAVLLAPQAGIQSMTVSADVDLTVTPSVFGDVRHFASGVEVWTFGSRAGFRGGVTTNTTGESRTSFSTGASIAVVRGIFVEVSGTAGSDESIRGWTTALKLQF